MILPIYTYGQPVLKKHCIAIEKDHPGLQELIVNMWETMYNASGVGLAAPQIGMPIRLFLVDSTQLTESLDGKEGFKAVMINAQVVEEFGDDFSYEEGCLSIPDIRGNVIRPDSIKINYFDENFIEHQAVFTDINARVIQHEYDHIEGILFTELLKPVKRKLLSKKLGNMKKGRVTADYPIRNV